jgi:hypothetical protein
MNTKTKFPRLKAFFYEAVPREIKTRWYHARAYYRAETNHVIMVLWPFHHLVAFAWWLNWKLASYLHRPSWIDRALKTVPPALVIRHHFINGSTYPCAYVNWRREGGWGGGGWIGEVTVWHSPKDRDEHTHNITIGQGCPLGQVSLYFDNFGYGTWEMSHLDGVDITERDLQWATLWGMLALKSRRKVGDLRALNK